MDCMQKKKCIMWHGYFYHEAVPVSSTLTPVSGTIIPCTFLRHVPVFYCWGFSIKSYLVNSLIYRSCPSKVYCTIRVHLCCIQFQLLSGFWMMVNLVKTGPLSLWDKFFFLVRFSTLFGFVFIMNGEHVIYSSLESSSVNNFFKLSLIFSRWTCHMKNFVHTLPLPEN